VEGSKDYQSLVTEAEEYYINHRDLLHCEPSIGEEIFTLLNSIEYDIGEFKKAESNLPPPDGKLTLHTKCLYCLFKTDSCKTTHLYYDSFLGNNCITGRILTK
jgi:hypothetical protein